MNIKYIVVHTSDSPSGRGDTAETIHKWHLERGWDGIGYHFVILENGKVERGRPVYWQGSHVANHNSESIGICMIGEDTFTEDQFRSLRDLINELKKTYIDADVVGHNNLDYRKDCPNFDVIKWWANG